MAATLRISPTVLQSTATQFEQAGTAVTALQPGRHLAELPSAMSGLTSAAALGQAASALDAATGRVGGDLSRFSSNVSRALQSYERADGQLAGDVQNAMGDEDSRDEDEGPGVEKDIADWTDAWLKNTREIEAHNAKPQPNPNDAAAVAAYNDEANKLNYERTKLWMEAGEIFHDEAERQERTGGWTPPGWTPGTNGPTGPPLVPGGPLDTSSLPGQPIPEGAPGHAPEW